MNGACKKACDSLYLSISVSQKWHLVNEPQCPDKIKFIGLLLLKLRQKCP